MYMYVVVKEGSECVRDWMDSKRNRMNESVNVEFVVTKIKQIIYNVMDKSSVLVSCS